MKLLIDFSALAAVPLSLVRPHLEGGWDRSRYRDIFEQHGSGQSGKRYRIYIPLATGKPIEDVVVPGAIQNYLSGKRISVDNYVLGLGRLPDGRVAKLGRVLNLEPDLKRLFDQDPQRKGSTVKALVVVSRHPYDILGMSFDRGWTSCMDVREGMYRKYLQGEIIGGSLVSYLVKADDKNINSPIARILLRPHLNKKNSLLVPGPVYGSAPPSFMRTIVGFCNTVLNVGKPRGTYKLAETSYDDDVAEATKPAVLHHEDPNVKELSTAQRTLLARNPLISEKVLLELAGDESAAVRVRVARNLNAAPSVLRLLATDKSKNVRAYVADNNGLGPDIMDILARDKSVEVRNVLAGNPGITASVCSYLLEQGDEAVLQRLAMNPGTSPSVLAALVTVDSERVRSEVALNPNVTVELLMTLLNDSDSMVYRAAVKSLSMPISVLEGFTTDQRSGVRFELSRRPDLTVKMIMVLKDDPDKDVRHGLVENSSLSTEQNRILLTSKYVDVRKNLVKFIGPTEHNTSPSLLIDLASDKDKEVRIAVLNKCLALLRSKYTTGIAEVLDILSQDPVLAIARDAVQLRTRV